MVSTLELEELNDFGLFNSDQCRNGNENKSTTPISRSSELKVGSATRGIAKSGRPSHSLKHTVYRPYEFQVLQVQHAQRPSVVSCTTGRPPRFSLNRHWSETTKVPVKFSSKYENLRKNQQQQQKWTLLSKTTSLV